MRRGLIGVGAPLIASAPGIDVDRNDARMEEDVFRYPKESFRSLWRVFVATIRKRDRMGVYLVVLPVA